MIDGVVLSWRNRTSKTERWEISQLYLVSEELEHELNSAHSQTEALKQKVSQSQAFKIASVQLRISLIFHCNRSESNLSPIDDKENTQNQMGIMTMKTHFVESNKIVLAHLENWKVKLDHLKSWPADIFISTQSL